MIVYLDTSALVKLYVPEVGSAEVSRAVGAAETVNTSLLTYVETRSALSRTRRLGGLTHDRYATLLANFEASWDGYSLITVDLSLVRSAGDLAERHSLRAIDAMHLASAERLRQASQAPITFICADRALHEAALASGLDAMLVG